jgi:hypothetical protein
VGHLERGVVDQDVDPAELADRPVHDFLAVLPLGQVAGHQDRRAPRLLDQGGGVLGVLVLGQVRDQHVGALAGERDGHRPADAGVGARDDRLLAGQPAGSPVRGLAVVGLAAHVAQRAWGLLGGLGHDLSPASGRCRCRVE